MAKHAQAPLHVASGKAINALPKKTEGVKSLHRLKR